MIGHFTQKQTDTSTISNILPTLLMSPMTHFYVPHENIHEFIELYFNNLTMQEAQRTYIWDPFY